MREWVGKGKKATTSSFSISTLRQPIRGFGLESSEVPQAVTIQGYQDFTGQVTAALGKFQNVDPTDGRTYNVTIYGSIDPDLITGKTTTKKGIVHKTTIDTGNLDKVTTVTNQNNGQQLSEKKENQLEKLLFNLNTQNWAGADRTHSIDIFLENGTPQHLIRQLQNNQWIKR